MNQQVNLELKEIELQTNVLNVTGITYNNTLYIDMITFAKKAKISYKTVQRLVLKLKPINDTNSTYLLMFNNPNKNFVSNIFLDKQKRKLVTKNQFSSHFKVIEKSNTNKKNIETGTIENVNMVDKKDDIKGSLIEPDPIYDDITVLRNDEYFSNQQKEYTVFYGKYKWQTFNNFHLELEMDQNAIDLFMRGFLLKLRKESSNLAINIKLLYTVERNKSIGGGYHVHFVTSVDDHSKIRSFHKILKNVSNSFKDVFNFKSQVYNGNLKGLRYIFKESNLKTFRTGYYDDNSIV